VTRAKELDLLSFADAHVAVTQHLPRWLEELEDLTV